ncbi:glutaredoxin family protein [Spirochaeta thermophila]|uniref:Glutaredoxin domain-containing protein n=1 Tax=Winmispira thermophila (strain ATCC 49972 / DSM 6192 / RI 19.B1) TaxID=665571 RepID=E0RQW8_WINT6|nr:glutaredoxin domain-containing protein [Spirochaeta thermophila]ADN03024.1 hypothetical protein STHERM_c20930 [Spirochaeta thermophila DSM 6192]
MAYEFTRFEGRDVPYKVTVYGLSTCGFCRRAVEFLKEHEIPFDYLEVDLLPREERLSLKASLANEFEVRVGFPFLVVEWPEGRREFRVGFIRADWEDLLL